MLARRDVAHEDPDLAVVDLAEPPEPLTLHADGGGSLLGESRGVEDDDPVGGAQVGPDLAGQFHQQGLMIPRGGADEVLETATVEVGAVGDGLGVLALQVGDEPGEIGLGMASLLVADQAGGERLDEVGEALEDAVEGLGSEVAFGEELLLAEFKSLLHRSISREKGPRRKAIVQSNFGYLQ